MLQQSTGKRIWLQHLTGGLLATWEDSRSIFSSNFLMPPRKFWWKFASIYGRTGRMRARLWLSIWQEERGFKGEETAQAGFESAIWHWKLTSASVRLPLLVMRSRYFWKVPAQETLWGLDPVRWLCCLKIVIITQILVAQWSTKWCFVQYYLLQILSSMVTMGLAI